MKEAFQNLTPMRNGLSFYSNYRLFLKSEEKLLRKGWWIPNVELHHLL